MKIYSICATVVAVAVMALAGYFYSRNAGIRGQLEACRRDKAVAEAQVSFAGEQIAKIAKTVTAFRSINESFMIPGDLRALTVGSREAAEVEQKIGEIVDKQDRMMAEKDWSDFRTSLRLNALFSLFRNVGNNLDRALQQPATR